MNQIAKKSLIEKYTNDSRLKEIDRIFESQYPACLRATAVFGAQECFIVRGLYERQKRPFLIVAENKEAAAYFWNTLSLLFDKKQIYFFRHLLINLKKPSHPPTKSPLFIFLLYFIYKNYYFKNHII